MTRTGLSRAPVALWAAWLLVAAASPAPPLDAVRTGGSPLVLVLGPDGVVYTWREGDPLLSPLPSTLAQISGRPVNDLATSADGGRLVVLLASSSESAARHPRHEGSAVVVSNPAPPATLRVLSEIAFDGDGRRVAVSPDGRRAYVLAVRYTAGAAREPIQTWLDALDLDEGRVVSSARLDSPPGALALDPAGERLYLAYTGRIVSYSTRPLARSWHYLSPGENRALSFRPQSAILTSVRQREVALFDPRVSAALKPEERRKRQDDATSIVPLPFVADALLFSRDGLLAVAYGSGSGLAFIDPEAGAIITSAAQDVTLDAQRLARPFHFGAGPGDLAIGSFPDRRVRLVHPPAIPRGESPIAEQSFPSADNNPKAVSTPSITPVPPPGPPPIPNPTPAPTATPAPTPGPAGPPDDTSPVLAGRLTNRVELVRTIVLYGPGSLVREEGRVAPDAGGNWRFPLPPPGVYRIVPLGEGSRPLRSEPNFHTVEVKDQGRSDLDFKILGAS